MKKIMILVMALAVSLGTVACNKKNEGSKVSRVQRGYGNGSGIVTSNGQSAGWDALAQSTSATLRGSNVSNAAYDLLTITVQEDQIGTIEDVVVAMNIYRSGSGQIDASRTRLGIVVWDDYALSNQADPLTVLMDPVVGANVSGSVNGNRVQVNFQDEYGSIYVNGNISGNQFTGSISYTKNGSRKTLGNFTLPVSGVIF